VQANANGNAQGSSRKLGVGRHLQQPFLFFGFVIFDCTKIRACYNSHVLSLARFVLPTRPGNFLSGAGQWLDFQKHWELRGRATRQH
jgi:hypothetical protein